MRDALTALLLAMSTAVTLPGATAAAPEQPQVAISCDAAGTALPDRLCPILIETLNDTAAGRALFLPGDEAVAATLHVRLEISLAGSHLLKGRLLWRADPDGTETAGPEVTLTVLDSELTEAAIGNFARALAKVSELPIAE